MLAACNSAPPLRYDNTAASALNSASTAPRRGATCARADQPPPETSLSCASTPRASNRQVSPCQVQDKLRSAPHAARSTPLLGPSSKSTWQDALTTGLANNPPGASEGATTQCGSPRAAPSNSAGPRRTKLTPPKYRRTLTGSECAS